MDRFEIYEYDMVNKKRGERMWSRDTFSSAERLAENIVTKHNRDLEAVHKFCEEECCNMMVAGDKAALIRDRADDQAEGRRIAEHYSLDLHIQNGNTWVIENGAKTMIIEIGPNLESAIKDGTLKAKCEEMMDMLSEHVS